MLTLMLGVSLPAAYAQVPSVDLAATKPTALAVVAAVETQAYSAPATVTVPAVQFDEPAATSMHEWRVWHKAKLAAEAKKKAEAAAKKKAAAAKKVAAKAAAIQRKNLVIAASTPAGAKQQYAFSLMASTYGWTGGDQQTCLVNLWNRESGWSTTAANASSGAYGIPQALPGSKMATVGSDWQTNYKTQIKWGLQYIAGSYGSPCGAWAHSNAAGWY